MPEGTTMSPKGKGVRIVLTERLCKGCGICIEMCPVKVFVAEDGTGKAIVSARESCTGCGLCELYCPDYALSLEREVAQ